MALIEDYVKIREKQISHRLTNAIPPYEYCQCNHKNVEHHSEMGCMHWELGLSDSGWCKCDGFRQKAKAS